MKSCSVVLSHISYLRVGWSWLCISRATQTISAPQAPVPIPTTDRLLLKRTLRVSCVQPPVSDNLVRSAKPPPPAENHYDSQRNNNDPVDPKHGGKLPPVLCEREERGAKECLKHE